MASRTRASLARPEIVGIPAGDWLTRSLGRLNPGSASKWLEIPVGVAQEILQQTTRLVADLPTTGNRNVVWVSGTDELSVSTDHVTLSCQPGLVVVTIPVACDQLPVGAGRVQPSVGVPLAVGTLEQPRGLMMATLTTPVGPQVVTDIWADSLTAFAWESLLTLAREVAAAVGHDRTGSTLVPVAIGATTDILLVRPMAPHA